MSGYADIIDITSKTLWEIKYKDVLGANDIIQTAFYNIMTRDKATRSLLFNVKNGTILEIHVETE